MIFKGSFEDYLYILIGLIWVAFSIYKGAQKKKSLSKSQHLPNTETDKETKKSFFDEFLNQIISEDEVVPYEPVNTEKSNAEPVFEEQFTEEKIFSYDDLVEESNFTEENSVYNITPVEEKYSRQELKSHLKSKSEKPEFDLKKAVIYSEILNRKYF